MDTPTYDFGLVLSVDAEAVGRPGQRRFRLLVRSSAQSACVWMEKVQLAGIGTWLSEMCERLDKEKPTDAPDVEPLPFAAAYDVDVQATQVGLGYQEDEGTFVIQAFDAASFAAGQQQVRFRCELSRGQSRVLSRKIEEVVAAGRPICPLCQNPIDPDGHVCPKSNGHHAPVTV